MKWHNETLLSGMRGKEDRKPDLPGQMAVFSFERIPLEMTWPNLIFLVCKIKITVPPSSGWYED